AAFEAFSMHVPVTPTGDGAADGRAVLQALLDGRAACVFDAVAPAAGVRLEPDGAGGVALRVDGALPLGAEVRFVHDGRPAGPAAPILGGWRTACAPGCAGSWRAEAWLDGRPWIFTNPAVIE
ncbi:MAG TPA: PHP domain-containing protein, partial [Anaeromyxobacteraceae bacterium]|nr:PHP domain-containing protein [Anaeromyxobacteraceae bacterium]